MSTGKVTQCGVCLKIFPKSSQECVPGRRLCKNCRKHINSEKYKTNKEANKLKTKKKLLTIY
mgnify:CR=1 FL=1